MITVETADNALKSFYLDAVTEALDLKVNPLLAQIQKSSIDVVGKDVKKLVKYGINGGISAGSETGALPTASSSDKVMLTSTLLGIITMILFKPRSWCIYCPMGTMTQLICKARNHGKLKEEN